MAARFVRLSPDAESLAFVEQALAAPHGTLPGTAFQLLRRFLGDFDAYGLLGIFPMHLLSRAQWRQLVPERRGRLLDVGAGDGAITARGADQFDQIWASEASAVMRRKLATRGFHLLHTDLQQHAAATDTRFEVVSAFNVLDRCSFPRQLLRNMHAALAQHGQLLISLPLPLRPHVQVGGQTVDPEQTLPSDDASWEAGASCLIERFFVPEGLALRSLSRLPYLCRGGRERPLIALDTALFVLEAADR